jgi:ABC-2 type transport system ATP-binding protein
VLDLQERQAAAATAAASPAIHCVDLAKRYGKTVALAGLTMTVPRGEVFGFLGPNGAGKTTAVKLLVGLVRPTSGEAWLLGRPLGERQVRRRIGYLPELFRYQPWLSAREVLRVHCELARLPRSTWREEIDTALQVAGLTERAGDRVGTYSKGMQQRLGLAVALLGAPEIVFLDEPTSALEPVGRSDVRALIERLRARGTTVFLNSHLLGEVERVCDRVCVVDRGRVVAQGTVEALTGATRGVRVRLDDGWREFDCAPAEIPDVIARLVREGARIHAVEPNQTTLEDRFLALVAHA